MKSRRFTHALLLAVALQALVLGCSEGGAPDATQGVVGDGWSEFRLLARGRVCLAQLKEHSASHDSLLSSDFEIRVVSSEADRVPIAEVVCLVEDKHKNVTCSAITDANGYARVCVSSTSESVVMRKGGFVSRIVDLRESVRSAEVRFEQGRAISGAVADAMGQSPGGGFFVVAQPLAARDVDWRSLRPGLFFGGAELVVAGVEGSGEFLLGELDPNVDYLLRGFGPGSATEIAVVRSGSSQKRVNLLGGKVLGVDVLLTESTSGGRVSCWPGVGGSWAGISEKFVPGSRAQYSPIADEALVVAGIEANPSLYLGDPSRHLLTAIVPFRSSASVDAVVTVRLPGYHAGEFALSYSRPDDAGAFASAELELSPTKSGFGTIRLQLSGMKSASDSELLGGLRSFLQIERVSEGAERSDWWEYEVDLREKQSDIHSIPAGRYRMKIRAADNLAMVRMKEPEEVVTVATDNVSVVNFDLGELYVVPIVLSDSKGREYEGEFQGEIIHADARSYGRRQFQFDGPPYELVGLPSGTFVLVAGSPFMYPTPANPKEAGAPFEVGPQYDGMVHDIEVVF